MWLCGRTAWTDGLACVCLTERAQDGVRCDIDDKPVCLSLVSPWLNVRSQWKGGTTNVTESLWQPDPWERRYPFNQMPLIPKCPIPSQTLFHFLSRCFLLVMSNSSLLNLCFSLCRLQCHQLFCHLCSLSPFPPYTHREMQMQTHTLYPSLPVTLSSWSNGTNR